MCANENEFYFFKIYARSITAPPQMFSSSKPVLPNAAALREKADKFNIDVETRLVENAITIANVAASVGLYETVITYDDIFKGKFGPDVTIDLLVKHSHGAITKLKTMNFSASIEDRSLTISWAPVVTPAF